MEIKELLREWCPNIQILRRAVSIAKLKSLDQKLIPAEESEKGQIDFVVRKTLVEKYNAKWPAYAKSANEKINNLFFKAPAYQERSDLEELRINILFYRYAYGFLPEEYLSFGLEKKSIEEAKEYISDIERIKMDCRMSDMADSKIYKNKMRTYQCFKEYYKREAILLSKERDKKKLIDFSKDHTSFIVKEPFESCGRGIDFIDISEGNQSIDDFYSDLISSGSAIVEELISQSDSLSQLNNTSVNTVRCITFYTRSGVIIPYCFIKIGRKGSRVDNGGAGGILAGIDSESGKIVTNGFTEYGEEYVVHPDSEIAFQGYQLPDWVEMKKICTELAKMTPSVKYIGWDLAHTNDGWVIVEGNNCSQLIGPQIVWQRGIKSEILDLMSDMDLIV